MAAIALATGSLHGVERDTTTDGERRDVERAAAGDAAAFERLYRRHVARVHSLARRLLGPARADDATQDVFLLAWRKLGSFRGQGPFGAWLFRLARNWMLTELGRARREGPKVDLDDVVEPSAPRAEPGRALDVDSALEKLPEGARRVLALHHFAGCTHEEIAGLLGVTVGTSKSQLHRARLLLREHLAGGRDERGRARGRS